LKVRLTEEGDRFVPFGMKGAKLVSDFLTDQKKSLFEKREQMVLVHPNNDILWVIGERPDNRYRVTAETKAVLIIELRP
jgi:tRNA(Ile)-lysidine synthase